MQFESSWLQHLHECDEHDLNFYQAEKKKYWILCIKTVWWVDPRQQPNTYRDSLLLLSPMDWGENTRKVKRLVDLGF